MFAVYLKVIPNMYALLFSYMQIINADGGKSWVEEHMMKSTGSIIIRRPGGNLMGTKLKDMYLEVVGM